MLPLMEHAILFTLFKINQNEISKTICVQRQLINNTCNGRCELQKSLKKLNDNEKDFDNRLKENTHIVYVKSLLETNYTLNVFIFVTKKKFYSAVQKPISIVLYHFRPPSASFYFSKCF